MPILRQLRAQPGAQVPLQAWRGHPTDPTAGCPTCSMACAWSASCRCLWNSGSPCSERAPKSHLIPRRLARPREVPGAAGTAHRWFQISAAARLASSRHQPRGQARSSRCGLKRWGNPLEAKSAERRQTRYCRRRLQFLRPPCLKHVGRDFGARPALKVRVLTLRRSGSGVP